MMPVVMSAASQVETWKEPTITRNSPTKPLVPGSPIEAMVNSMNTAA